MTTPRPDELADELGQHARGHPARWRSALAAATAVMDGAREPAAAPETWAERLVASPAYQAARAQLEAAAGEAVDACTRGTDATRSALRADLLATRAAAWVALDIFGIWVERALASRDALQLERALTWMTIIDAALDPRDQMLALQDVYTRAHATLPDAVRAAFDAAAGRAATHHPHGWEALSATLRAIGRAPLDDDDDGDEKPG